MKGQHFLVDGRIAERQIGYASLSDKDVVGLQIPLQNRWTAFQMLRSYAMTY